LALGIVLGTAAVIVLRVAMIGITPYTQTMMGATFAAMVAWCVLFYGLRRLFSRRRVQG
jgi:hypothetical protein